MRPEDVGLSPELQFFNPVSGAANPIPRVTQTTIYNCQNFSVSKIYYMFCIITLLSYGKFSSIVLRFSGNFWYK